MKSTNRRRFLGVVGASLFAGCSATQMGTQPSQQTTSTDETTTTTTTTTTEQTQTTEEEQNVDSTHPVGGTKEVKVDLHSHVRWGGGQKMADRYAELGFDALVGTDHPQDLEADIPSHEEGEQVEDYSDLDFPGPILNGIELSEDRHVNVIKSENEMIKQINHPMKYDMDAEEIRTFAERIGADLIEVTDDGGKLDVYPSITDVKNDLNLNPTVGSDAHEADAIGNGYVVVEVEEVTGDAIIQALKEGTYSLGGRFLW